MLTSRLVFHQRAVSRRIAAPVVRCLSSKAPVPKKEEQGDVAVSKVKEKVEKMRNRQPFLVKGALNEDSMLPAPPMPENVSELKYLDAADLTNVASRYKMDGTERTVIIRQMTKSARQNPFNHEKFWHIRFTEDGTQSEDWYNSLMDWTSSADPYQSEPPLVFNNAAEAVHFAKKRGWKYQVDEPILRTTSDVDVQYQDNFLPQKIASQVKEEGASCRVWERDSAGTSHYFRPLNYHGNGLARQHGPNREAEIAPSKDGYYKIR